MDPIRVVIVDPHALVVEALCRLLESTGEVSVVGMATSAADGLATVIENGPDVVIVEARLADVSGIDLVKSIRSTVQHSKVLIVTTSEDPVTVAAAMDAGIHGYLVKTSPSVQLLQAIRTAHSGGLYFDEPARRAYEAWSTNPHSLSETETKILRLVGKGLDHKAVAESMSISVSTLKRNLQSIATKLNAANPIDAAFEATRRGLI